MTLEFGAGARAPAEGGRQARAVLTRDDDIFLSLAERVEFGAAAPCGALRLDPCRHGARGLCARRHRLYACPTTPRTRSPQALAERENRSDILAGLALEDQPDDVADILFDLARRETQEPLGPLRQDAGRRHATATCALNANPWRRASFRVLKAPDVPSVLLELGYLSNTDDEKLFQAPTTGRPTRPRRSPRAIEAFFGGKRDAPGQ